MSPPSFAMALLVLVALLLGAVGGTPAQSGPIKIGFITDLTGPAAQAAKDMVNGITMYLDEIGSQMAGRKVELIVEDSQGRPDAAVTKLRKVVEHDRVQLVAGVLFGHVGYAMAPKVEEYKVPALFTVTAADDLTQRQKYRWVIRTGWASSQPSHPFGEYVAKTLGHRKVAVIASDYAFGWEVVGGFQRTFEENGGQVIQKLWAPLGVMDLAPYIAKIRRDADAALPMIPGRSTPMATPARTSTCAGWSATARASCRTPSSSPSPRCRSSGNTRRRSSFASPSTAATCLHAARAERGRLEGRQHHLLAVVRARGASQSVARREHGQEDDKAGGNERHDDRQCRPERERDRAEHRRAHPPHLRHEQLEDPAARVEDVRHDQVRGGGDEHEQRRARQPERQAAAALASERHGEEHGQAQDAGRSHDQVVGQPPQLPPRHDVRGM